MRDGHNGTIRIGIGGWSYPPWRGAFYPDMPQARELEYAASRLTSIEINATYHRSQKPESFAKWHDETPDGFVFAVKAPRFATNRRVLADAGEAIERFFASGVMALKEKLGPVNWQFMASKKFDPADFTAFLQLLPKTIAGRAIRHAIEVRHESFRTPEFVAMMREQGAAIVFAGDSLHPQIADLTAPFVYARIMGSKEAGYPQSLLERWVVRAKCWAAGGMPEGLETVAPQNADGRGRDVYLYVIGGHKAGNPAAARALIERLGAA